MKGLYGDGGWMVDAPTIIVSTVDATTMSRDYNNLMIVCSHVVSFVFLSFTKAGQEDETNNDRQNKDDPKQKGGW